jgi:hypothetical protein
MTDLDSDSEEPIYSSAIINTAGMGRRELQTLIEEIVKKEYAIKWPFFIGFCLCIAAACLLAFCGRAETGALQMKMELGTFKGPLAGFLVAVAAWLAYLSRPVVIIRKVETELGSRLSRRRK